MEIPNRSSVQTISPTLGVIKNEPLEDELLEDEDEAAASRSMPGIYLRT
jgi:hypothetical protein